MSQERAENKRVIQNLREQVNTVKAGIVSTVEEIAKQPKMLATRLALGALVVGAGYLPPFTPSVEASQIANVDGISRSADKPTSPFDSQALTLDNSSNLRSVAATEACPALPTDGNPAPYCVVGPDSNLVAASEVFRDYYIGERGQPYTAESKDVQGVPDARMLVETIAPNGSSDFVQIDPNSRRITNINGKDTVQYYDTKNNQWRDVSSYTVLSLDHNGGDGRAVDPKTGSTVETWNLPAGTHPDKIWGPTNPDEKVTKQTGGCGTDGHICDWQCVQWVVVSRLNTTADISDPNKPLPNTAIHEDQKPDGRVTKSSITDFVYYWDLNKGETVHVDGSFLNSPVTEGSPLWISEGLKYNPNVKRPQVIVDYSMR